MKTRALGEKELNTQQTATDNSHLAQIEVPRCNHLRSELELW